MTDLAITKERWDTLIKKTLHYHEYMQGLGNDVQDNEIELIIAVLKCNTPFEVCDDSHDGIENKPFNIVEN